MSTKTLAVAYVFTAALVLAGCDSKKKDPVEPTGTGADRVLQSVSVSSGPYHPLDHVVVKFSVKNVSAMSADPVSASIRLSSDATLTTSDQDIGPAISIPAIAAGDSTATIALEIVIPETVAAGAYFVGVLVAGDDDPVLSNDAVAVAAAIDLPYHLQANRLAVAAYPGYCALTPAKAIYCWGTNARWAFGAGTPAGSSSPVLTSLPATFTQLSRGNGNDHMCALTGTAATCWGRADAGMLGNGVLAPGTFSGPVTVSGSITWQSITVSQLSACGVSTTGVGYCWGANQHGEVGSASIATGGTTSATTVATAPHLLDGSLTFKSVVAGWLHACGLTTTGAAYCWGENAYGQLGIGTVDTVSHRTPVAVSGGLTFIQLALGSRTTCGITPAHIAYCWGTDTTGQVGSGSIASYRASPTAVVGGLRFSYISVGSGFGDGFPVTGFPQAGTAHTCALTETGTPYCWGYNAMGELGDGTTATRTAPVAVAGSLKFNTIAAGGTSTCGMNGNQIRCWGGNFSGQLGVGSFVDSPVPMTLPAPFATP